MLLKHIKKNIKTIVIFLTIISIINIFNYLFQISSVDKIYNVEMVLKNSLKFKLREGSKTSRLRFNQEITNFTGAISTSAIMSKYIQKRFKNVVSYESNSNENFKIIKKYCGSSNVRIDQEFIMVQCKTIQPYNVDINLKKQLDLILLEIISDDNIEVSSARRLMKLGGITFAIDEENPSELLSSSIIYSQNRLRNILTLNSILIFLIALLILRAFNQKKKNN